MAYWACTACHSLNDDRSKRCYRCRAKRTADAPVPVETVRPVYDEWASTRLAEEHLARTGRGPREPSVIGALVVGLVAACFATAAWVVFEGGGNRRVIFAAMIVGFIVATATVLGARGRTSFVIMLVSGLLTIASVAVGEYLIISDLIAAPGSSGVVIGQPEAVWAALVAALPDAPLRPVLWLAAVFEGFAIPWSRLVGPAEGLRA